MSGQAGKISASFFTFGEEIRQNQRSERIEKTFLFGEDANGRWRSECSLFYTIPVDFLVKYCYPYKGGKNGDNNS